MRRFSHRLFSEHQHSNIQTNHNSDPHSQVYPKGETAEFKDRTAFAHLMKELLHLDRDQRISPCHALLHPFITVSHPDNAAYLTISQSLMIVCPVEGSADRNTSAASAAGFCFRGLPPGCKDEAPAPRSCDNCPIILSSDVHVVPCTYCTAVTKIQLPGLLINQVLDHVVEDHCLSHFVKLHMAGLMVDYHLVP